MTNAMDITQAIDARHAPCQPATVDIHACADPEFTRRFGKRVKAAGGDYSHARGNQCTRFVTVPITEPEMIDEIVAAYPHYKKTTVIFNGMAVRAGNAHAPWSVQHVATGETIKSAWSRFVTATRGEHIQKDVTEHYAQQARRADEAKRARKIDVEVEGVACTGSFQEMIAGMITDGYNENEIANIVARAARQCCDHS